MLPEEATNRDNVKNRSRSPLLADNVVETCNKMYEDTPSKHHPTLSMEGVGGGGGGGVIGLIAKLTLIVDLQPTGIF